MQRRAETLPNCSTPKDATKLDPTYALAYKNLALLHRDVLHDPTAAEQYFAKYRSLGGK
jgi:hypothetical protein